MASKQLIQEAMKVLGGVKGESRGEQTFIRNVFLSEQIFDVVDAANEEHGFMLEDMETISLSEGVGGFEFYLGSRVDEEPSQGPFRFYFDANHETFSFTTRRWFPFDEIDVRGFERLLLKEYRSRMDVAFLKSLAGSLYMEIFQELDQHGLDILYAINQERT